MNRTRKLTETCGAVGCLVITLLALGALRTVRAFCATFGTAYVTHHDWITQLKQQNQKGDIT